MEWRITVELCLNTRANDQSNFTTSVGWESVLYKIIYVNVHYYLNKYHHQLFNQSVFRKLEHSIQLQEINNNIILSFRNRSSTICSKGNIQICRYINKRVSKLLVTTQCSVSFNLKLKNAQIQSIQLLQWRRKTSRCGSHRNLNVK